MRNALINTALLLFVYLPLTGAIGVVGGYFESAGIDGGVEYDLFLWFVIAIQMLVPTIVAFVAALVLTRLWLRLAGPTGARIVLVAAIAALLPLTQAALWGGVRLGIEWFVVAVLPALILGWLTRFTPVTDTQTSPVS